MRYIWNILLKGLAAVLPVGLTLYLVYWLGVSIEKVLHPLLSTIVPEQYYWPGLGLIAGLVLLFLVGLVVNAWLVRKLFHFGEDMLERIPLIKTVYAALRDFIEFFSSSRQHKNIKQVVMITIQDTRLIGFLTSEHVNDIPGLPTDEEYVAVYLPMSYQIGGYTLYLPRTRVEELDMSIEEAMRRVLMAGLSKPSLQEDI
ncbi:DUF502 domain-containing protein [Sulfuriflexus sp.]|uniref:DUF502 domain-containing protein n=1 Tax=Sulfuriflexus sp. TaxID=2015443 RepID=UPI0028CE5DC3|nr:DUF502 domain-containing protein [Sulfuriflexus sp.]MDT8404736.1 DUF502 domain-containing protein [Sulfuriflexus sp.]